MYNQVLPYDEKNSIEKKIFEDLNSCYRKLIQLQEFCENVGISLPIPSYANFRDALFHYEKIFENDGMLVVNGNIYTFNEHLQRSVKDAIVTLLNRFVLWLECFCVKNSSFNNVALIINTEFPFFNDINKWDIGLFAETINKLTESLNINKATANKCCLYYCVGIVQQNNENLIKLRHYLHIFKNHTHKIRSSSSILARPYNDDSEFSKLIEDVFDFMDFVSISNIKHCLYFLYK